MPLIARRALPSRLNLVMRCTPTRDHICKNTHARALQRARSSAAGGSGPVVAVASGALQGVGSKFAPHTRALTVGRQFLGYSGRDACPRPPEGTHFSAKASLSPAPPNRGMAGFDEKAHATGASAHITVCKACLHAPRSRLLPVAKLRPTAPSCEPNSIGNSASVASAIVG